MALVKEEEEEDDDITIPPSQPESGLPILAHKLWLVYLVRNWTRDPELYRKQLVKILSAHGKIRSWKYMLHYSGVNRGEPRDYCFVEFTSREEAEKAKSALDGKKALGKKLHVNWAKLDAATQNVSTTWNATAVSSSLSEEASTSAKIKALEAKLKMMEAENDQLDNHSSLQDSSSLRIHRHSKPYNKPQHINR